MRLFGRESQEDGREGLNEMHCANYSGARLASMCWKDHLMPKKGEKPVELWTNHYCGHTAMYYLPEQLEPCTEEYYKEQEEAYKERRRAKAREYYQLQKERKQLQEERKREAAERRRTKPRTSWQWLSEERRKIRPGAEAFPKDYTLHAREPGEYDVVTWYYYNYEDTVAATDEEYEKLKAAYIEKFGGWDEIDLKHTTYDGHKWY